MSSLAKVFIVAAVVFSVWGDYCLKRYGDERRWADLVGCLFLWEVCAMMWVIAYRQRVPLGRSTTFGQALVVAANVLIGRLVFSEQMRPAQWFGVALVAVGIVLVG